MHLPPLLPPPAGRQRRRQAAGTLKDLPLSHPPRTPLAAAVMAARRPREPSSLQPAVPRVQGVDQLPDDPLTRILGALSLRERCARREQGPQGLLPRLPPVRHPLPPPSLLNASRCPRLQAAPRAGQPAIAQLRSRS